MKAFVIKNKEGKYLGVSSSDYEHYWTTLDFAHYFRYLEGHDAKAEAEEFRNARYPDCEVVKITITEGDLEKEIEHWHNLFKQKEQQFQSVRERYHLLNRLQANYDKKDKLHLSEMQCLELVEKNEKLEQQLAEKDRDIKELKTQFDLYRSTSIQKDWNDTELINSIRHQVCDEIREFIAKDLCGCSIEEWTHKIGWNEDLIKVFNKLDQIEKGELK